MLLELDPLGYPDGDRQCMVVKGFEVLCQLAQAKGVSISLYVGDTLLKLDGPARHETLLAAVQALHPLHSQAAANSVPLPQRAASGVSFQEAGGILNGDRRRQRRRLGDRLGEVERTTDLLRGGCGNVASCAVHAES
mmetsp:Transcript_10872/g.35758  ORF Transcript_10872/g.35758 Transcript_10872/m.35758 type:complete len:137 (+) Transcript_10872:2-412(+)